MSYSQYCSRELFTSIKWEIHRNCIAKHLSESADYHVNIYCCLYPRGILSCNQVIKCVDKLLNMQLKNIIKNDLTCQNICNRVQLVFIYMEKWKIAMKLKLCPIRFIRRRVSASQWIFRFLYLEWQRASGGIETPNYCSVVLIQHYPS